MTALLQNGAVVAATVYTMSLGRIGAIVAGLLALTAIVFGALALRRIGSERRRGAMTALTLGAIAISVGGSVVATADGGVGTGNGLGGGVVAMVIGLIGISLGTLAWTRSRRTG